MRRDESAQPTAEKSLRKGEVDPFGRRKLEFSNIQISIQYLETVFKNTEKGEILQKVHHLWGSKHTKPNMLTWRMFMSASMNAAIHMGPDCIEILEVCQNTNFEELQNLFEELQNLFDITQKLVHKQRESLNVRMIECASPSWTRSSLAQDQAIKWSRQKYELIQIQSYALEK